MGLGEMIWIWCKGFQWQGFSFFFFFFFAWEFSSQWLGDWWWEHLWWGGQANVRWWLGRAWRHSGWTTCSAVPVHPCHPLSKVEVSPTPSRLCSAVFSTLAIVVANPARLDAPVVPIPLVPPS